MEYVIVNIYRDIINILENACSKRVISRVKHGLIYSNVNMGFKFRM